MGRGRSGALSVLLGLLLAGGGTGCTRTVAGTPAAAPPAAFPVSAAPTAERAAGSAPARGATAGSVVVPAPAAVRPASSGTAAAPDPTGAAPTGPALEPDVLADECLLDAAQLTALLGRPVRAPRQEVVVRDDGSRSSSCYVTAATGPSTPLAAINVYGVRAGTPAEFVRAGAVGGRTLTGVGEAAAVIETTSGVTVQVAGARLLVTIAVPDRGPDDRAWRTAARAALARLPA